MANKVYDENSIQSLSSLEFTRLRPGVYVGSTEYSTQLVIEAVSNAIDEYKSGHGSIIKVNITPDNIISVSDAGQGFIPNSYRDDGKTILEAAFSVLNTSAKFTEDGVYEGTALGLNGIGSKLVTFLSHTCEVKTWRDGKYEHIYFKEGVFDKRESGAWTDKSNPSGTIVTWQPSEEFFTNPEIEYPVIKKLFKVLSCLCPGLTIQLNEEIFYSKKGLNDLVDEAVGTSEILKNRLVISENRINGKNGIDLVLTYTDSYSSTIVSYVNTGLTDSGPHITQIKTIITREMNKFFREKKWLKEKEAALSGEDIQEGMYLAFNLTAAGVAYDAQTKSRIVKLDMSSFTPIITEALRNWLGNNEKDIKQLAEKALKARKAREAAKKARETARQPKKEKGLKAKMQLSDKFVDCQSRDPSKRVLLLVEGLSAGGSALEARNVVSDCIYMLRGKVLSVLKSSPEKVLANQELSDIIKVVGAGWGKNFDLSKMDFDKIVITSDMDSDGASIELLLIAFFYTYMRPLVEAGKLYRAVTPLYIVTTKKEKYYLYTEKELDDWKASHTEKYELTHAKGLGEVSAEVLKEICFERQRYKRITVSDAKATEELLEVLEGKDVKPRKQYIYDNATRLGFNFM